jgi:hypothetical protein
MKDGGFPGLFVLKHLIKPGERLPIQDIGLPAGVKDAAEKAERALINIFDASMHLIITTICFNNTFALIEDKEGIYCIRKP